MTSKPSLSDVDDLGFSSSDVDHAHDYCIQRIERAVPHVIRELFPGRLDRHVLAEVDRLLEVFLALQPRERRQLITLPAFGYWWFRVFRASREGDASEVQRWLPQLARLVFVPGLRAGVWDRHPVRLPIWRGELRFPGWPRQLCGASPEADHALARTVDGGLSFEIGGTTHSLAPSELLDLATPPAPPWRDRVTLAGTAIELDAGDPYYQLLFDSLNRRPIAPEYVAWLAGRPRALGAIERVTPEMRGCFERARDLIARVWPDAASELANYTRCIVPIRSNLDSTFTDTAFIGAVFMGECRFPFANTLFTAEHLLHEHSHLRFAAVQEVDPLLDADPGYRVTPPWRADPRPIARVFWGALVFARIAELFGRISAVDDDAAVRDRLTEVRRILAATAEVLNDESHVSYTPLGKRMLAGMAARAC